MEQVVFEYLNQGFAVAVAIYSLTRLEKSMRDNTAAITALVHKIEGGKE